MINERVRDLAYQCYRTSTNPVHRYEFGKILITVLEEEQKSLLREIKGPEVKK